MFKERMLLGSALCAMLAFTTPAGADVVGDWNLIATQAVAAAGAARPGPSGQIDIAMVQIAVHDAVQAYQGRFELYGGPIDGAAGSVVAAVATAARDVLMGCGLVTTPAGSVDSLYTDYLTTRGLGGDAGIVVGQTAAAHILALRASNDGRVPANAEVFVGGTSIGEWRPTSFTAAGQPAPMVAAYLRGLRPFTLKDASQFLPGPPPKLKTHKYAEEYEEVRSLGGLTGSDRRPSQTDIALFFADTPVMYWNRAMRTIATLDLTDIGEIARMFALVNMAMADALIGCWESKVHFNYWRPITAIRLGDDDDNRRTIGDPTWTPYITTPNYPDYASGANALTGAATVMLANVLGSDRFSFELTSTFVHPTTGEKPQNPRRYVRFSDAADDVVEARIYLGIHFRSADEDARSQGKHIANWAYAHFLRATR